MRRLFISAAALAALALAAIVWSFAPVRLEPAALALAGLPQATPPPGMSISALPTGEMGSRAAFAYRGGSFDDERTFSQTAILVRHPRGDLLFDTGLGEHAREHFASTPWLMHTLSVLTLATPAAKQLSDAGYDLAKLSGIVPTHAHWDHISGVPDFAGVPLWLNDVERAFIASGGTATALMRSLGQVAIKRYELAKTGYLGFADSLDVWGDGSVVLVSAPGHTPGSILVFVTLPSQKRFVLLGDLVWQTEGIKLPAERPWLTRRLVDQDVAQTRAAIEHVAALHLRFPELTLLPAHDARAMAALPVFPRTVH